MKHRPVVLIVAEQARHALLGSRCRSVFGSCELVCVEGAEKAEEELGRGRFALALVSTADAVLLDAFARALARAALDLPLVVQWESAASPSEAAARRVDAWSAGGPLEEELLSQAIQGVLRKRKDRAFVELLEGQVAHDLRGPLGIIDMGAQLQLEARSLDAVPPLAQRIRNAARRLRDLSADVVELGRLRLAPGREPERAPGELAVPLAARFEELRVDHARRSLEWEATGDTKGDWDAPRFAWLLGALVDAVVRASQAPAPVRVALDGTRADQIVLSVTAEGARLEERALEVSATRLEDLELLGKEESPGVPLRLFLARSWADELGGRLVPLTGTASGFRFEIGRAP